MLTEGCKLMQIPMVMLQMHHAVESGNVITCIMINCLRSSMCSRNIGGSRLADIRAVSVKQIACGESRIFLLKHVVSLVCSRS